MGSSFENNFKKESEHIAFDLIHRGKIHFNISKYNAAVIKGNERYADRERAKKIAANKKRYALEHLDELLVQFEENHTKNGGKVLWALDSKEAILHITSIIKEYNAKLVIKSKSMTTEEIELNEELEKIGVESIESDLGEYIVQLANEKPYHIVTPAMHKSKQDVADLFHEKFNTPVDSTPEELTGIARKNLRNTFLNADVGITGANFILPDIGGIAVTENEGNAIMSTAFPKIHIAIVGIEKMLSTFTDLSLFWPHLAQHGTGQAITVYNSIFTGPRKNDESSGPEKMYVILLDNNRTTLYGGDHKVALSCIRCGACLNACPIYKNIGGYTYASTYQGPIGSVITPHLQDFKNFQHLNSACSVCGNCSEVCPVKIPLHEQILLNRNEAVQKKSAINSEKISMKGYSLMMRFPLFLKLNKGLKNACMPILFGGLWGRKRQFPKFNTPFRNAFKASKK